MSHMEDNLDQRAAALLAEVEAEDGAVTPEDHHDEPDETPKAEAAKDAKAPTEPAAEEPQLSDSEKARLERLAQFRAEEQARAARRSEQEQQEAMRKRLDELQGKIEAPKPKAGPVYDLTTPDGFFAAAAEAGVDPESLASFVSEQLNNPQKAATRAARAQLDPELASLKEQIRQQQEAIQSFMRQQQEQAHQAQQQATIQRFGDWLTEQHGGSLAARYYKTFGAGDFHTELVGAAQKYGVPDSAGPDAYFDALEQHLTEVAQRLRPVLYIEQTSATAPRAAATAKPLTNRDATERSAVVDEDDWGSLPIHERAERLKRSVG